MLDQALSENAKAYPTEIEAQAEVVNVKSGKQPVGEPSKEVDFTLIKGIGKVFDRRLKAANVSTFAQLASMTPEQIGDILESSARRVIDDDLIEQARRLADEL